MISDDDDELETVVKAIMAQLQEKHKAKQTGSRAVQTYLDNLRRLKGGWDVATAIALTGSSFENKAVPNEVKDLIRYWKDMDDGKFTIFNSHSQADFL
ncbi:hypothetical protein COL516b_001565 [Colletotrichum fioriniae]|nr:uncharacterized protein COL516b_001565 [Colletotrichum fioriniae]KAJ0312481.1 hypothetical protein COL516b_001565 [Colletotrichum fioriniae]